VAKLFKLHGSKNGSWYFRVTRNGKRIRICTHTADERLAKEIRNQNLADAAKIKSGTSTRAEIHIAKYAKSTIESQLAIWIASLVAHGGSCGHAKDCERSIRRVASRWDWQTISDMEEDGLTLWMAGEKASGKSNRYIQKHGRNLKQFAKWLVGADKISRDPFRRIKLPNPAAGRKLRRRMLLPDEWIWLEKSLKNSPERYGMSAKERRMLYDLAIQTGLRNSELRLIIVADLIVGKTECSVSLRTEYTKNRKGAKQYIRRQLAQELKSQRKLQQAKLLPVPRREACAEMLRSDLDHARKLWLESKESDAASLFLTPTNASGEKLDFHSLRHTCGAWMAIEGVNPQLIQKVMRHSTITLTLGTYGHLMPNREQDAVESQGRILIVAKSGPPNGRNMASSGSN